MNLIDEFVQKTAYISARKGILVTDVSWWRLGTFTAQLLGTKRTEQQTYQLLPSGIDPQKVNPKIASLNRKILLDKIVEIKADDNGLTCVKLSMGLGEQQAVLWPEFFKIFFKKHIYS